VWEQEAIQRLLHTHLSTDDIEQLADLCVQERYGTQDVSTSHPTPSADEILSRLDTEEVVELTAISGVKGVNALANDQTLRFGTGLTIVQGQNGSGKSGYARILKQVCRSRSNEDVLPNAFADEAITPTADISFEVDGIPHMQQWLRGDDSDGLEALFAVSVYDNNATSIYIDKNNDLAYRPFGLDLYDRLVDACDRVKSEIDRRVRAHRATRPSFDELHGKHAVGRLLGQLNAHTAESDVYTLANWTAEDAEALRLARDNLAQLRQSSPSNLASDKRAQAGRVRDLSERLQGLFNQLSDEKLTTYQQLRLRAAGARRAADQAATDLFDDAPLTGVGTEAWRSLWEAAKSYSQGHAYPEYDFPVTHDGARCVLCQQQLSLSAAQRLQKFKEFVAGKLATEALELETQLEGVERTLRELDCTVPHLVAAEIQQLGGPTAERITTAMDNAHWRTEVALGEWEQVTELPEVFDGCLLSELSELASSLDEAADDLEGSGSEEAIAAAKERVDALEAQEKLAARRDEIVAAIAWHEKNDALQAAKSSISTRGITEQSARATEEFVSQSLLDGFTDKLSALGAGDLPVRLKPQAREGEVLHSLELVGASSRTRPSSVLSEGERSVVSLAAFFAEVELAPALSAIVLDDPVTSLDHVYRERVVHQIYDEVQRRQVVVFTHDAVFVSELLDTFQSNNKRGLVSHYSVNRATDTGLVSEGPPWELLKVSDRIEQLQKRCREAKELWDMNQHSAYEDHVKRTLQLLRESWERAVEEVVLHGTVKRFSRQVRTQNLPQVVKLTADDVKTVENGMSVTSTQGHDRAAAAMQPTPQPDYLREQVTKLDRFCKEYRKR
jgi:energy-coupling factor transporter ATP-binding protein EcfA2